MEERTPALRYMEFYDKTDPKVIFEAFTHNDISITHNDINCVNNGQSGESSPYNIFKVDRAATKIQSCFKGRKARMEVIGEQFTSSKLMYILTLST